LPYHREKTVVFDTQQVQQLTVAAMTHRPAHLRLYAFALLLQLLSGHFGSPRVGAVSPSAEILTPVIYSECEARHTVRMSTAGAAADRSWRDRADGATNCEAKLIPFF
jgi:hypothetical protein